MELSTVEAGAAIGLSDQAIRDHIAAGRLAARKHGMKGLFKIKADDLRAFARQFGYLVDEEYLAGLASR